LIYPVLSRRSRGLSLGVNLFPDIKTCSFDCPYCEVFPFPEAGAFSAARLKAELSLFLDREWSGTWAPEPIRDICISGNGEPSLSPHLEEAAAICIEARRARPDLLGDSGLVIITNSTGFLREESRLVLSRAQDEGFELWAKLDGGTEAVFSRMARSPFTLKEMLEGIRGYAAEHPITIQTMLCAVDNWAPGDDDLRGYAEVVGALLDGGALIPSIQLYTFARPSPGGRCRALPDSELARWAAELRRSLAGSGRGPGPGIAAFGARGLLPAEPERR